MNTIKLGHAGKSEVYFDLGTAYNKHITILGKSGAGKSVAAQKILLELIKSNKEEGENNEHCDSI